MSRRTQRGNGRRSRCAKKTQQRIELLDLRKKQAVEEERRRKIELLDRVRKKISLASSLSRDGKASVSGNRASYYVFDAEGRWYPDAHCVSQRLEKFELWALTEMDEAEFVPHRPFSPLEKLARCAL